MVLTIVRSPGSSHVSDELNKGGGMVSPSDRTSLNATSDQVVDDDNPSSDDMDGVSSSDEDEYYDDDFSDDDEDDLVDFDFDAEKTKRVVVRRYGEDRPTTGRRRGKKNIKWRPNKIFFDDRRVTSVNWGRTPLVAVDGYNWGDGKPRRCIRKNRNKERQPRQRVSSMLIDN